MVSLPVAMTMLPHHIAVCRLMGLALGSRLPPLDNRSVIVVALCGSCVGARGIIICEAGCPCNRHLPCILLESPVLLHEVSRTHMYDESGLHMQATSSGRGSRSRLSAEAATNAAQGSPNILTASGSFSMSGIALCSLVYGALICYEHPGM